jgi:hypothetical protein
VLAATRLLALPLASFWQEPVPDPVLPEGTPVPAHIRDRSGRAAYRPDRG